MKLGTRERRPGAVTVLLVSALLVAACGGDDDDAATGSSAAAPTTVAGDTTAAPSSAEGATTSASADAAEADRDASFTYAISFGFNTLDPHHSPSPGDALWLRPLYDRLFTIDNTPDGAALVPQLATGYEFSEDGLSLSISLREGVTFQDGTAFDANAVKANLERAVGEDSTVRSFLLSVESVEVVDPMNVVIHLTGRDPSIPWVLAQGTTGMMVSPAAMGNADLATNPVGSGPYKLVSATKDADVVYERWDGYWDPDAGLVKSLTLSTIGDVNVRYNATQSGEVDAAYMSSPLDAESEALTEEGFHWQQAFSPVAWSLLLNIEKEPFDDVRVRRAVSMAIDRQGIAETILSGLNPVAYQQFQEGYLGHDPALDLDPYDPDAARALVEEAGATGATVQVIQNQTPPGNSLAQVIQQELGDIGLNVELVPLGASEATPAWRDGTYAASVGNNAGQAEPSLSLKIGYLGAGYPAEPPAELVQMADAALALPVDSPEQEAAYQAISAYLVENPVLVPIAQFTTVHLCRPNVVGCDTLPELGQLDFRHVAIAAA